MVKRIEVKYLSAILLVIVHSVMAGPIINMRLPRLEAGALDGSRLVLPDSAEGSVTLVGVGYRRESQDDLSSWLFPFRKQFEPAGGFRAYEIPMMGPRIPGLLRGVINRAMRNAIAEPNLRWVAPFYGNIDEYSKQLGVTDRSRVHMFLLDGSGVVRWHAAGPADSTGLAALRFEVAKLAAGGGE